MAEIAPLDLSPAHAAMTADDLVADLCRLLREGLVEAALDDDAGPRFRPTLRGRVASGHDDDDQGGVD